MFFNHNEAKLENIEKFWAIQKCMEIKQHTYNQKVKEEIPIKITEGRARWLTPVI